MEIHRICRLNIGNQVLYLASTEYLSPSTLPGIEDNRIRSNILALIIVYQNELIWKDTVIRRLQTQNFKLKETIQNTIEFHTRCTRRNLPFRLGNLYFLLFSQSLG